MPTLSNYLTQVEYLLHDANNNFWTVDQLTGYINEARSQLVRDTGIRQVERLELLLQHILLAQIFSRLPPHFQMVRQLCYTFKMQRLFLFRRYLKALIRLTF